MRSFLVTLVATVALTPIVWLLMRRLRVLDRPSERSLHSTPTPRGGGLGAVVAVLGGLLLAGELVPDRARAFLGVAAAAYALLGLLDDFKDVPVVVRLCAQTAIAAGSLLLLPIGTPGFAGALLYPVSVVWLVAFVNAFNFMDGINGISATQAAITGVTWWIVGRTHGTGSLEIVAGLIAAGAIGFAPFNISHPIVFMGDVGSYFFGAWLAVVALLGVRARIPAEAMLFPLLVYLADTGTTLFSRFRRGERWLLPHREHVYQRLVRAGWSHGATAVIVGAFVSMISALGLVSLANSAGWRIAADGVAFTLVVGYLLLPSTIAIMGSPGARGAGSTLGR